MLTVNSLSKTGSLNDVEINEILDQALDWLENEPEVRVKDVISDLLFTLCQVFGDHVFHKCKDKVNELCHSHLERKIDPDQDEKVIAMRPGTEVSRSINKVLVSTGVKSLLCFKSRNGDRVDFSEK